MFASAPSYASGPPLSDARRELVHRLACTIVAVVHRPTLVAIEGRSAAGKTTFSIGLAAALRELDRPVLQISIDDFHTPGHKERSIARAYTPESFVAEGYSYDELRRLVIDPLTTGSRRCKPAMWDSANDVAAAAEWVDADASTIAIVEGSCLFHPTLRDAWHYAVWLDIDWDTMIARAVERDVAWVGNVDAVIRKYREFWIPMHAYYESLTQAKERCDAVIDNRNVDAPVLVRSTR